jgi:hypothetical protein
VTDDQGTEQQEEQKDQEQDESRAEDERDETRSEDEQDGGGGDQDDDEVAKARKAAEEEEQAKKKVKELEENPPENLEDWPDDKAKYETFGGAEGDESYEDSVTSKLGPSSLRYRDDGGVEIEGEEVDDPDDYKSDPIPGGPTDPRISDARAYGEPDLTDETSIDAEARASDDDGDSESSGDGDGESSGDGDAESASEGERSEASADEADD